jgi:predicted NAD/FAD-binding protein
MSFSVVNEELNLTYGAEGLSRLFAQKRNLIRPQFYQMLWDIQRFNKAAPALLDLHDDQLTLGEYLDEQGYSKAFVEGHILPMASALWSASSTQVRQFPARYFVAFMANHRMLQIKDRPQWLTVKGGSHQYVEALLNQFKGTLLLDTPVIKVYRKPTNVEIVTKYHKQQYDQVIFACHSNQALSMLENPSRAEQNILGAIKYQENIVTLHSDTKQMPKEKAAWASWNASVSAETDAQCRVSYWMNLLQDIHCHTPLIVTLNGHQEIDPKKVFAQRIYEHPEYTPHSLAAQKDKKMINGQNNTYYCGAYWGWGFHEDGVKSALDVVRLLSHQGGQQHVYV